jgi:hypothetical protein
VPLRIKSPVVQNKRKGNDKAAKKSKADDGQISGRTGLTKEQIAAMTKALSVSQERTKADNKERMHTYDPRESETTNKKRRIDNILKDNPPSGMYNVYIYIYTYIYTYMYMYTLHKY